MMNQSDNLAEGLYAICIENIPRIILPSKGEEEREISKFGSSRNHSRIF